MFHRPVIHKVTFGQLSSIFVPAYRPVTYQPVSYRRVSKAALTARSRPIITIELSIHGSIVITNEIIFDGKSKASLSRGLTHATTIV